MSRFIISAILAVCSSTICMAQNDSTVMITKDSTVSYRPSGIRFGADLVGPAKLLFKNQPKEWEASADIDFNKYYLNVDFGRGSKTTSGSEFSETNKGQFIRFGPEVNLIKPGPHILFFGLKRGIANQSDTFSGNADYWYWGSGIISKAQEKIKSKWWEINLGMKVQLINSFYIGFTTRYKFGLKQFGEINELEPSYVPGYGSTSLGNTWGFTYSAYYKIPFIKN